MSDNLTERQRDTFEMIVDFVKDHGIAPTVREIADDFGVGIQAACHIINALERKGLIGKHDGVARGIYIRLGDVCPCCGQQLKAEK